MEIFYDTQNHSDKNILWCKELGRGRGWSGGAMVLGELPVAGRPTVWMIVGQRPIALAVGAGGGVWTFYSRLSFPSAFSLSPGDGPICRNTVSKGR